VTNRHSETRIQSPIRKRVETMTTIIEEKVMAEDEETLDTGEMRRQPQEQTSPRQVFASDWLLIACAYSCRQHGEVERSETSGRLQIQLWFTCDQILRLRTQNGSLLTAES
jgi:hypothetical protein